MIRMNSTTLGAISMLAVSALVGPGLAQEGRWFRGNLHTHSLWSDGARTIAEMALANSENRPQRVTGDQAAHIVEILEAISTSIRAECRRTSWNRSVTSSPNWVDPL